MLHSLAALIVLYKTPINDTPEVIDFFKKEWATNNAAHVVRSVLGNRNFWGQDLNAIEGFTKLVTENVLMLDIK